MIADFITDDVTRWWKILLIGQGKGVVNEKDNALTK